MPAINHRGNITVSTGFLNERLAQANARRASMAGENFDPEEENYDLAYGPKNRVRKAGGPNIYGVINEQEEAETRAEERRMRLGE